MGDMFWWVVIAGSAISLVVMVPFFFVALEREMKNSK